MKETKPRRLLFVKAGPGDQLLLQKNICSVLDLLLGIILQWKTIAYVSGVYRVVTLT